MIQAIRLEHVNLGVSDIDASIQFYTSIFGWHVRWRGSTEKGPRAAHVGNDEFFIAMFERPGGESKHDRYADIGINHFGFVVEDLDRTVKSLKDAGYEISSDDTYDPGRHVYILDPDGIELELVQYQPGEKTGDPSAASQAENLSV